MCKLSPECAAEKALECGLINKVVDDGDLMTEALGVATRLANGPKSLGLMRKAYWESLNNSYTDQLQLEADLQDVAGQTSDNAEGIAAFLEKRPAKFMGE